MIGRALLVTVGAMTIGWPARADDGLPMTRFFGGFGGGPLLGLGVSASDGRRSTERAGEAPNMLVFLGIDRRVVPWLALGVEGHVATWDSATSAAAGYDAQHTRALFDLDGVIRLRSPVATFFRRPVTFSLSPSGGFTWPRAPSRETRAVMESWRTHRGGNVAVELTVETWVVQLGPHWKIGAAAGVGWARHWFALDGTFTPVDDPGAAVSTRYDYVTDRFIFKLAVLAGL